MRRQSIAIKMADTADALIKRVREATPGMFPDPNTARLPSELGIDPMLLGLAMELALKAWITFDQGTKIIREHNLAKLFAMLKPEQRAKIETEFLVTFPWYNPSYLHHGTDVFSILEHHAEAFMKWRYMYEIEHGYFSISQMQDALEIVLKLFRSRYMLKNLDNHPVI